MIRLTGPFQLLLSFAHKLRDDNVSAFAGATTLFTVISFFPFLMFLITVTQYLPMTDDALFQLLRALLPQGLSDYVIALLKDLVYRSGGTLLWATAIASLWAGSKGFVAIERGLNHIYMVEEQRNFFMRRLFSLIYTLLLATLVLSALSVFVFGNQLAEKLIVVYPSLRALAGIIQSIRSGVGLLLMVVCFSVMFCYIPNRSKQSKNFFTELPGAIVASGGWIVCSYLFSLYINNLSRFVAIYGSLTAIVLCILWLYLCMYIFFVGAEINSLLCLYELRD